MTPVISGIALFMVVTMQVKTSDKLTVEQLTVINAISDVHQTCITLQSRINQLIGTCDAISVTDVPVVSYQKCRSALGHHPHLRMVILTLFDDLAVLNQALLCLKDKAIMEIHRG